MKERVDTLEAQQHIFDDAVESCPMSFLALENSVIKYVNRSAKKLLGAKIGENIRLYIRSQKEFDLLFDELETNGLVSWRPVAINNIEENEIDCLINISPKKHNDRNLLFVWFCEKGNSAVIQSEIEVVREIAEKNSRAKSEFILEMSHDIRTPMNAILGFANILQKTGLSEKQKEYVNKIEDASRALFGTINNILDFSRIETSKLELHTVEFKLDDILMDIQTVISTKASEKNLSYEVNVDADISMNYYSDPIRLKQILKILLDNAVDFTSRGKVSLSVKEIEAEADFKTILFEIRDTGVGMSSSQVADLFAPISIADAAAVRKYGGIGLNLIVARRLVRIFGGEIWCESHVDDGAAFFFTVKLSSVNSAGDESIESDNYIDPSEYLYDDSDINKNKTVRILVAEDIDINRMIIEEFLKMKGYCPDFAVNGADALAMIEAVDYDIVFMDIRMPVMDGLTATREIRKNSKCKNLPIIAMTAHARPEDRQRSISAGMNSHITKPVESEFVYNAIKRWVVKDT